MNSKLDRAHYENQYLRGQLKELKSLSTATAINLDVVDLCVMAEALAGDFTKALWHQEKALNLQIDLPTEQRAAIHFALGVGWTRVSEYKKAKVEFARLARFKSSTERARFFLFQSMGFFHFFTGKFKKSAHYAEVALKLATRSDYAFGKLISEEVLALGYLESGSIHLGLKHLNRAIDFAQKNGSESLASGFELNRLLYEARFGIAKNPVKDLAEALRSLHPEDSYSRNNVKLEMANQLILHGRSEEAQNTLEEASDNIYSSRNRRQIALLNFRLSFLIYLRGSTENAIHLLRSAEHHLHESVDLNLLKKMRGLRSRLEGRKVPASTQWTFGEDRIGDIAQIVRKRRSDSLQVILKSGLHHFLYFHFNLEPNQRLLAFDVIPHGVIALDRGQIQLFPRGFSHILRKIVQTLSQGHVSKEELVKSVWGYEYDPLRHDPLVYTTISKIRGFLGSYGDWIENDHRGYRLKAGVQIWSPLETFEPPPSLFPEIPLRGATHSDLPIRLLRIMSVLEKTSPSATIDTRFVMEKFYVSRATATRDLNELVSKGLLRKLGRARATVYFKGDL